MLMNTEKTVRKQAKKVLEGNRSVIISEVMVTVLAFLTGLFAFSLAMSVAGLYDVKNPNQTQQMLTMIFGLVFFAFVVVCLPLINGVYRSVCNVVRGRECSPLDVFYYYKKPKLFFKSVILDVISVGLFFIISGLLNVFNYLSAVSDKIIDNSPSLTAVVAVLLVLAFIVSTAVVVVCYIIFVHYTFLAYGFNEHLPLGIYLPRMMAFSIKNFISTIKLFIGFIGWGALCFFFFPAFYAVPYFLTTSAMSAKCGSGKMAKAKKRFFFRPICEYAQREGIELVYIRSFHNANPFTINLIKELKRQVRHVVMEIPKDKFEHILEEQKAAQGVTLDQELSADSLLAVIDRSKALYRREIGQDFPEDVTQQLFLSIEAVFRSWNNHRAIVYRNLNKIDHNLGTAVNIQSMVFGNMGDDSGSGVAFTRNPSTGEKKLYGEYLINAQGTVVFLCHTRSGKNIIKQLLTFGSDIFHQYRHKEHALIAAL